MEMTRRGFLKASGGALATAMAFELTSKSQAFALESDQNFKLDRTDEYTNICCYCAGGCGSLCSVRDGELVNLEGDPDHPINKGGLCPKGATMAQLRNIVDDAIKEIARKVKDTRDANFEEKDADGLTVNRTTAIASLGGSQQNSEEEYLILKMMRSLGVIAIDNQARV